MGRTLMPFRPALDMEIQSWAEFRRGLRPEDRPVFDTLANYARQHADAGSLAARPMLSEILFFSFAIEQQKRIAELSAKIEKLEKSLAVRAPPVVVIAPQSTEKGQDHEKRAT